MIFTFRLVMTGESMRLPQVKPQFNEVQFSTPSTNSGSVYLGDVPVNAEEGHIRFAVPADRHFPLKIADLSELYADGTNGDALDMICAVKPKTEVKPYARIVKPRATS